MPALTNRYFGLPDTSSWASVVDFADIADPKTIPSQHKSGYS